MSDPRLTPPPRRPGIERPFTLADIIDTNEEQPAIWVAYPGPGNFKVQVRPLGRKQAEFIEAATSPQWDTALLVKRQVLDQDKYLELFLAWAVESWSGLTVEVLRRLVLLQNWRGLARYEGEIACDARAKLLLAQYSPAFAIWLNQICLNVELYNSEREEEAEKKP